MDKDGAKKEPEPKLNNFGSATLNLKLSIYFLKTCRYSIWATKIDTTI